MFYNEINGWNKEIWRQTDKFRTRSVDFSHLQDDGVRFIVWINWQRKRDFPLRKMEKCKEKDGW